MATAAAARREQVALAHLGARAWRLFQEEAGQAARLRGVGPGKRSLTGWPRGKGKERNEKREKNK